MQRLKIRTALFRLPIAFTTLAFGVMIFVFPYFIDDLWYIEPVRDWFLGIDDTFPLDGLRECWRQHYATDNIRLANLTFSLLMLVPRWVGAAFTVIATLANLLLLCRLSNLSGKNSVIMAVWVCLLYSIGLPWVSEQAVLNYAVNYVWASAITLLLASVVLSDKSVGVIPAAALGFICGMWHEGFSVPALGATVAVMALRPQKYATRTNIIIAIGLIAGIAVLGMCPGALNRNKISELFDPATIFSTILRQPMLWAFMASALAGACIPRVRRRLDFGLVVFVAVAGMINFAIHLATHFAVRIAWCGELLAIAGMAHCTRALLDAVPDSWRNITSMAVMAATVGASAFLAVHLVVADYMTVKVAGQMKSIIERCRRPGPDLIFADYTNEFDAPLIAVRKTGFNMFSYLWTLNCFNKVYGSKGPKLIVDSRLRAVTPDSGHPIGGTPGMRRLGNCFFMPNDGYFSKEYDGEGVGAVIIGGRPLKRNITIVPFVSEADGRDYVQIYPSECVGRFGIYPITGIIVP